MYRFFAVFVEQEGDAGVAVGVVFDRLNGSGNAVFVAAEVDRLYTAVCDRLPCGGR